MAHDLNHPAQVPALVVAGRARVRNAPKFWRVLDHGRPGPPAPMCFEARGCPMGAIASAMLAIARAFVSPTPPSFGQRGSGSAVQRPQRWACR